MAVTIHYRPISKPAPHFNGGTSSDLAVLEKHFNGLLTKADVPALRAMAALEGHDFFNEVANTVEQFGDIAVFGSW